MGPIAIYNWLTVQGLSLAQWEKNRPWVQGGKQAVWFAPWRYKGGAPLWLRYDPKQGHFEAPWLHPGSFDLLFSAPLWLDSWSALENHWLELAPTPQKTWEGAILQAEALLKALNPKVFEGLVAQGLHAQGWEESIFLFWAQQNAKKDEQLLETRLQNLLEGKLSFDEKFLKHRWSAWFVKKSQYQDFITNYLPPGEWVPGSDLKEQIVSALRQTQQQLQEPPLPVAAAFRPPLFHTLFLGAEEGGEDEESLLQEALLPKVPTHSWNDDFKVKRVQVLPWQGTLQKGPAGYYAPQELEAVRTYSQTVQHAAVVTLTPAQAAVYRVGVPNCQVFSLQQLLVEELNTRAFSSIIFCSLLTENIPLFVSRLYDEYPFIWPFVLNLNANLVLALDPQCLDVRLHHATGKVAQWMAENPSLLSEPAEELV